MLKKYLKNFAKEFWSLLKFIVIAVAIIVPIKYFVLEPFVIEGKSMNPTFQTWDYIMIDKNYSNFREIKRGDVVVFVPPKERDKDSILKYTGVFDPRKKYIKRIIALPNETIKVDDNQIFIQKKGEENFQKLNEPFIKENGKVSNLKKTLSENQYFVLGDNRSNSSDSEEWGPIEKSDILGSPIIQIFPRVEINPGRYNFEK